MADTGWGRLAQRIYTFCQEQELDSENEVSPTVAEPPGTLFLPTSMTLLTSVHAENDSRVYFMIVLTTDYCWRSWTCRIAAPYRSHVDWLSEIKLPNYQIYVTTEMSWCLPVESELSHVDSVRRVGRLWLVLALLRQLMCARCGLLLQSSRRSVVSMSVCMSVRPTYRQLMWRLRQTLVGHSSLVAVSI